MSTSQQDTPRSGGVSTRVLLAIGLIAAVVYIIAMWAKLPTVRTDHQRHSGVVSHRVAVERCHAIALPISSWPASPFR